MWEITGGMIGDRMMSNIFKVSDFPAETMVEKQWDCNWRCYHGESRPMWTLINSVKDTQLTGLVGEMALYRAE